MTDATANGGRDGGRNGGRDAGRDAGTSGRAAPAPAAAAARRAEDPTLMAGNAAEAAAFLKAIGHQGRLMILCHLATGEKSVTELEELLRARQAAVSQQLARLRLEGLVTPRREGKAIYYSLSDGRVRQLLSLVHELFCE